MQQFETLEFLTPIYEKQLNVFFTSACKDIAWVEYRSRKYVGIKQQVMHAI